MRRPFRITMINDRRIISVLIRITRTPHQYHPNIQGHQDQSIRIHKNLGPYCQMLLFSPTYDQVDFHSFQLLCNFHLYHCSISLNVKRLHPTNSNCTGCDGLRGEHCVKPGHHQAKEGGGELGQYQAGWKLSFSPASGAEGASTT